MSTAGLFQVGTSLTKPNAPSPDVFNKWYNEVHVADILAVPGVNTAIRYANADPTATPQFLAQYPVADLSTLASEEMKKVPMTHETFAGPTNLITEVVDVAPRVFGHIQTYEPESKPGPAKFLLAVGITPAAGTDDDLDKWYREEHLEQLAACPGYRRTRRYKSLPGSEESTPAYMAFHEFDGEALPMAELSKTAETDWGKKSMGGAQKVEMTVWKLLGAFGEKEAKF